MINRRAFICFSDQLVICFQIYLHMAKRSFWKERAPSYAMGLTSS